MKSSFNLVLSAFPCFSFALPLVLMNGFSFLLTFLLRAVSLSLRNEWIIKSPFQFFFYSFNGHIRGAIFIGNYQEGFVRA